MHLRKHTFVRYGRGYLGLIVSQNRGHFTLKVDQKTAKGVVILNPGYQGGG